MASKDTAVATTDPAVDPLTGEVLPIGYQGLVPASEYGLEHRVSDLIPTPAAWSEFEQVKLDDFCNTDLILQDVMFFESLDFIDQRTGESSEWAILLFNVPHEAQPLTMSLGGKVLLRKLHQLKEWQRPDGKIGVLPCVGRFTAHASRIKGQHDYYDLT